MILTPTNRRVIRPSDKPSFEHTQRYGLIRGHLLGPAGGLIAYWIGNEGAGNKVFDLSGNGNTGTLVADTHFVPGKFGSALDFDGTGDYVNVPDVSSLRLTSITVTAWVYLNSTVGDQCFVSKHDGDISGWFLEQDGGTLSWVINSDAANSRVRAGTLSAGEWYHVAGTYDGTTLYSYINGIQQGSQVYGVEIRQSDDALTIGRLRGDWWDLNGQIDNVMIYNRARSASEIALLSREPYCMVQRKVSPVYFFVPIGVDATVTPATQALALAQHAPTVITRFVNIPPFMEKDLIDPYSGGAWLWLCEIAVPGESVKRIARNTENVRYDGRDFDRFNLQIGEQMFSGDGSIPRVTLRVFQDMNRTIEDMVNATEGALGAEIKLIRVCEKFLNNPVAALEADYENLAAESDSEWVTFTLGVPNPLTQRFPLRVYSSSVCPWATPSLFKGPDCQYNGGDGTCTGTYEDCYGKGNAVHWGAELGLDPNVVRV